METCGRWNEGKSFPQNDGRTCVCTTFLFLAPAQLLTSWKGSRHLSSFLVFEDSRTQHSSSASRHSSASREFLPSGLDCVRYSVGPWRGQHFGGKGHIRKQGSTQRRRHAPCLHSISTKRIISSPVSFISLVFDFMHLLVSDLNLNSSRRSRFTYSRGNLSPLFAMPRGKAWASVGWNETLSCQHEFNLLYRVHRHHNVARI